MADKSNKRELIADLFDTGDELSVEFADGFDEAIIGFDRINRKVVYSYNKMIEILIKEGNDQDSAVEYIDYNFDGFNEKRVTICDDSMMD